jgi:hypothetical protein
VIPTINDNHMIISIPSYHNHNNQQSVLYTLLRCYGSSQVLIIQERWRFESITNQLVIYSSHKLHSLASELQIFEPTIQVKSQVCQEPPYPRAVRMPGRTLNSPSCPCVLPHLRQYSALRAIYSARIISRHRGRNVLYSAS